MYVSVPVCLSGWPEMAYVFRQHEVSNLWPRSTIMATTSCIRNRLFFSNKKKNYKKLHVSRYACSECIALCGNENYIVTMEMSCCFLLLLLLC